MINSCALITGNGFLHKPYTDIRRPFLCNHDQITTVHAILVFQPNSKAECNKSLLYVQEVCQLYIYVLLDFCYQSIYYLHAATYFVNN